MEDLVREIAYLARRLQCDVEELRKEWSHSSESPESANSVAGGLQRIERRIEVLDGNTKELIGRVPQELGEVLTQLKQGIFAQVGEAIEENGWPDSGLLSQQKQANRSSRSVSGTLESLTRQERQVFQLCFQSGFLTYPEIGAYLDITPGAAKNLVNRMLLSEGKRSLFTKQYHRGVARVGLRPQLEKRILDGSDEERRTARIAHP
jgi:DNA-directed RNA polymerase specialized sigma24 family protein